jgi:acetylornithine aminotransferase
VIKSENLIENARQLGSYLMANLSSLPGIKEVRGRGLMIGIELEEPAEPIRKKLLYEGHVFTGAAGKHTVRLLPALSLSKEDADLFLQKFEEVIKAVYA